MGFEGHGSALSLRRRKDLGQFCRRRTGPRTGTDQGTKDRDRDRLIILSTSNIAPHPLRLPLRHDSISSSAHTMTSEIPAWRKNRPYSATKTSRAHGNACVSSTSPDITGRCCSLGGERWPAHSCPEPIRSFFRSRRTQRPSQSASRMRRAPVFRFHPKSSRWLSKTFSTKAALPSTPPSMK